MQDTFEPTATCPRHLIVLLDPNVEEGTVNLSEIFPTRTKILPSLENARESFESKDG